jgi:glycosyltransferase involved in cell wall biosynthesis
MKHPLISVCCITYNHQDYIEDCIRGFLKQELTYNVEFLIHDDASTDQTQSLIKSLVGNDPRFKLILREKNIKSTGKAIFPLLFKEAQGKYIAMCEGDDYWTDPLKLQKQVDFLEGNPEYSICFHRVQILENGLLKSDDNDVTEKRFNKIIKKNRIGVNELIELGNFIHTPSVVFRKSSLPKLMPFELSHSTVGDFFLYILLTNENQYIKKFNEQMGVYRRGVGIYSTQSSFDMSFNILKYKTCILSFLDKEEHKEKLLKQIFLSIEKIKAREQKKSAELSYKKLIKLFIKKIKSDL